MKYRYPLLAVISLLINLTGFSQFNLNSYPSAQATIYLDLDGHEVEGTSWNTNGTIHCGPSNLTSSQVTEIFNRIAEDYRPFNVNITTDSSKYWAAPVNKRMRVVFTVTSSWYGAAGGVSYVGSFAWGDNTPAFVFTALLNYNTKNIAEAGAHEIGHTLGLRHQSSYDPNCNKTAEYNPGNGTGEIGWAPIMGVGYYRNFTLWNNGANPYGCTNYQDDLGIITGTLNGFGYRNDDHGNATDNSATAISWNNNHFSVEGVVERITDQDVFRFALPSNGNFHLDANPFNTGIGHLGSDLDMQVELLNGSQQLIGTFNPDQELGSVIDTPLTAGTYYLRVAGKGNLYAPEYASLGSYSLTAAFTPAAVLAVQKLELHGMAENNRHQFSWEIVADENISRQELESSTGNQFQPLATTLSNDLRSYTYLPLQSGSINYRLHVTFDNGQEFYSNTIALRNTPSWRLLPNGNATAGSLTVYTHSISAYEVIDYSGRLVLKGKLSQGNNTLSTALLTRGMYIIRVYGSGDIETEKFMKQ
jgi:metallopeptidase family M12-like protein